MWPRSPSRGIGHFRPVCLPAAAKSGLIGQAGTWSKTD